MADYVCVDMPENWRSDRNARVALVYLGGFRITHFKFCPLGLCILCISVYDSNSAAQVQVFHPTCYLYRIVISFLSIYDSLYSIEHILQRLYCTQVEKTE